MQQYDVQGRATSRGAQAAPPAHLAPAAALAALLVPVCLLVILFSAYMILAFLFGPKPAISPEVPRSFTALLRLISMIGALCGIAVAASSVVSAMKVRTKFERGDFDGASKSSKAAAQGYKMEAILLVMNLFLLATSVLT